ncbi:MAG: DNA-directed RNA polymerase subunit K [Desulfurococcaceae archaeon]
MSSLIKTYRKVISKRLTRFEIARVVGVRALQLSLGSPPLLDISDVEVKDPVYISILELINNILPMSILRPGESGGYEIVPVNKLITPEIKRYLGSILESWDIGRRV